MCRDDGGMDKKYERYEWGGLMICRDGREFNFWKLYYASHHYTRG